MGRQQYIFQFRESRNTEGSSNYYCRLSFFESSRNEILGMFLVCKKIHFIG